VLAETDKIIERSDVKRGYVLKEELLAYYKKITLDMIGPNSCLVEYVFTTLDSPIMNEVETICLPVR
jgi:hypothetical protein